MENKYYTPKIEEFHVGFEYEFAFNKKNYTKIVYDGSQVLKSKSYYDDYGCEYDAVEDDLKYCRVKYLDKEDIESFGFKYIDEDTYILPMLFKPIIFSPGKVWGDIIMHYHPEDNYTSITGFSEGQEEEYTLFMGLIKNKSELKKILQMIGVL